MDHHSSSLHRFSFVDLATSIPWSMRHPPIMFPYSILALSPGRCHTSGKVSQDFPGEASSNESKIMLWLCSKQLSRFCWKWSCSSRMKSMKHQTYYGNHIKPAIAKSINSTHFFGVEVQWTSNSTHSSHYVPMRCVMFVLNFWNYH